MSPVSDDCDSEWHNHCADERCVCACHVLFGANDDLDDALDLPAGA